MNRLACILSALTLSACASGAAPAAAQVPTPDDQPRTIHVNAVGEVRRTPDRAVISLAVETTAPTAAEASNRNAEAMNRVLEAIRRLGVDRNLIQTQRLELNPQYVWRHSLTKASYDPFPEVRMRSVFRLLDLKNQLSSNRTQGIPNMIALIRETARRVAA